MLINAVLSEKAFCGMYWTELGTGCLSMSRTPKRHKERSESLLAKGI